MYLKEQQVVFSYPMVLPKVPITLMTQSTLWATISTHLWPKMAENGRKQVFDDTYLHNLLFHTQICSIGQRVVFNYPMVSLKVPTTLITPYSYHMGHHSHSFVSQNSPKRLKTGL
jgi:hypothetical protein